MQDAGYDIDGLRHRKTDKDGQSSEEYGVGISTAASAPGTSGSTAPSISYIAGHMILGCEIDGQFRYHLGDALSSVRDVVDDSGNVIRSLEFDEYGNLLSSSGSGTVSPKTFVGGLSVNDDTADSGMFNMGHRGYAAGVLGRFISRDPIGHAGNLNLYAYPTNPVRYVDPEGLQEGAGVIFEPYDPYGQYDKIDFSLYEKEIQGLMESSAATADGFIPFGDPFSDCYDMTDPLNRESQFGGFVAQQAIVTAAGGILIKGFFKAVMPSQLYHFTSSSAATKIAQEGFKASATGIAGEGVYLTATSNATCATIQGARATEAVIVVDATAAEVLATYFPGTYKAVQVPMKAIKGVIFR